MNDKRLTTSQKRAKKRMLEQLRKEIKGLENEINHPKLNSLKMNTLKKVKTSLVVGRLVSPYILTGGIMFSLFAAAGKTPFIKDDIKKTLEIKKEMDSRGNIRYEQQYDEFENPEGTISYLGKWEKCHDDFYSREVRTYVIGKVSEATIIKLLENNGTNGLDEVFGKPISVRTQLQTDLTQDEIMTEPYLEAVLYSSDKNDFIFVKEPTSDNIGFSVIWLFLTGLTELLTINIRAKLSKFNFEDSIYEIEETYHSNENLDELKRKLAIKQNNYNRLTR